MEIRRVTDFIHDISLLKKNVEKFILKELLKQREVLFYSFHRGNVINKSDNSEISDSMM